VGNIVRIMAVVALALMSIAGIGVVAVAAPAGSITGSVHTDNGTAIQEASVNAYDSDTLMLKGETKTSSDGTYSITGLPSGSYIVKANKTGYLPEYWNEASTSDDADIVTVSDPGATTDIDFTLAPGNSISGHVYRDDGITPIHIASVRVYENVTEPGTWNWLAFTTSAADGFYSVATGTGPGSYLVRAEGWGYSLEYYDNVSTIDAATPVVVTADNDTTGIDFTLTQIGYISGRVYQADGVTPLANALISAYDNATAALITREKSDSTSGYYYINLAPGAYRIKATRSGYIDQWWDNVTTFDDATPVPVVGVDETPNRDFSLLPVQSVATNPATGVGTTFATLNGNLISKGAADNVTVSFEWGTTSGGPYTPTDNQTMTTVGTFSDNLTGLAPGTPYYFRAKAVGDSTTYGMEMSFTTSTTAPTVTTNVATDVATTSATLNGNLASLGTADNVTVSFEWGLTTAYGSGTSPVLMNATGTFAADLTGLTANTTYHFRAVAAGVGTSNGDDMSFTTSSTAPTVTTNAAADVAPNSATLNGNLTALGTASSVIVSFEWGTTAGGPYTNVTDNQTMTSTGSFSANLNGLTAGTTYYCKAKAVGHGTALGDEVSFITSTTPPTVATAAASSLAATTATLNGNLTALGTASSVIVSFQWGTTAGGPYTDVTDNHTMTGTGSFAANLTGLTAGTTYYCKAKAVGHGTTLGDEVSFTTSMTPPTVATAAASSLATTSATLNGNLTALGTATSVNVSFEWGTTTSYGSETAAQSMTAIGAFTANLSGLTANTTYHFRAKAVGHGAAAYGEDMTLTTASLPDTTAPVISLVSSSRMTKSGATVTWTTNELATSRVEYGLTEEYGSFTILDTNLVTSHSAELTGLKPGKDYHFRVISKDAAGNQAVSADDTFTTASRSGGMPTWAWVLIGLGVAGVIAGAALLIRGRTSQG
jgi:hypothetical protein